MQVWSLQLVVGNDNDLDLLTHFNLAELAALFIDEEVGDIRWCLHEHLSGVLLHGMFFDQAQGRQRERFNAADTAMAIATRADDLGGFTERRTQALA